MQPVNEAALQTEAQEVLFFLWVEEERRALHIWSICTRQPSSQESAGRLSEAMCVCVCVSHLRHTLVD